MKIRNHPLVLHPSSHPSNKDVTSRRCKVSLVFPSNISRGPFLHCRYRHIFFCQLKSNATIETGDNLRGAISGEHGGSDKISPTKFT